MNTEDLPVENPPIEETIQDVEDDLEDTGSIEKELPKKKEKRAKNELDLLS